MVSLREAKENLILTKTALEVTIEWASKEPTNLQLQILLATHCTNFLLAQLTVLIFEKSL